MSAVGKVPMAVTTDATIHFLRWPRAGTLLARAQLLKEGRRLVVGEVTIAHEGEDDAALVHAVLTYALPPA
jgi:acyl-coenzyme A thioesterase PaaI-like protein